MILQELKGLSLPAHNALQHTFQLSS